MSMTLTLHFEGWIQVRLATDPDPADEPRGVSGWTFALAGEPDLDRVIRLQNPVAPRSHGPLVGVFVRSVRAGRSGQEGGEDVPGHALVGAAVDLLDAPKFEGRNGIVAEDAQEFVHPFHLRVLQAPFVLERRNVLAVDDQGREQPLYQVDPALFRRYQPVDLGNSDDVVQATGVADAGEMRRQRAALVARDLEQARRAGDATLVAALEKRHEELAIENTIRDGLMRFRLIYGFDLNGPARVVDEVGVLGAAVDPVGPWPIAFWIGGWDADALCAYLRGTLTFPLAGA
jgi:hypothetical protein